MRFLKKNYMVIVMSIFLMFGSTMVAEAAKVSFAEKTYTIKVGQRINLTDELTE